MPAPLIRCPPVSRPGRAAAVAAVAALTALSGCTAPPRPAATDLREAPSATSSVPAVGTTAERAAVTELLRRRAAALVAGDEQGYAATLAEPTDAQGARQLAGYRAARALRVSRLEVTRVLMTQPEADDMVRAEAEVSYRVDDLDTADRRAHLAYDLVVEDGHWRVVSEEAVGAGAAPPWVAMPTLRVGRGEHAVVAGTVAASRLAEYAEVVDRALPRLRSQWESTPGRVLVLAPANAVEADSLLGRSVGAVGHVAATTEGPLGRDGRASGDRIVLDPTAYDRLTPSGRDVVLTHELTHVAVRASVAGRPALWLAEGYADHVGYRRADVSTSALLAPVAAHLRSAGAPIGLPGATDLEPGSGRIEVPYLVAWQAAELVADRYGEAALRRLVVEGSSTGTPADAEDATDRALETVLGTTRAQLTEGLRERLAHLSG